MHLRSLRTRFIVAYAGLIILGFGMLALLAGRQLAQHAREDYERQIQNEVMLVGRGFESPVVRFMSGDATRAELDLAIADYESQTGSQIQLLLFDEPVDNRRSGPPDDNTADDGPEPRPISPEWEIYPEIVAASQQARDFERRPDENGTLSIFVASPIFSRDGSLGYVQLWEPASNLDSAIYERWAALAIGVFFVTIAALLVSFWLSTSLIRPLGMLRDSAIELSQGNLFHRAPDFSTDEVDQVGAAFNHMANQVQAMLEEQRAFASNTSHELRTPLTTMRLRTEALRHDANLDAATREQYIQELDDELLHMTGLIGDLILLSRFDSGRAEVGMEQIDFLGFVESVTNQLQSRAGEKSIDLRVVAPEDLSDRPCVRANLNHLTVVFRNVLENAIKYSRSSEVKWTIQTDGAWLISSIADGGLGISSEQLPHVFDRFYRGDKAHSRSTPGTGLGLSLVKAIAEMYGGQIEVSSPGLEKGTTVTVRWKLHP